MKYRIIRDSFSGYEAQFRPRWSPFWFQCFGTNTSKTVKGAREVCKTHADGVVEYYEPKITFKERPTPAKSKTLKWFPEKPNWHDKRKFIREVKRVRDMFSTSGRRNARRRLARMEQKPVTVGGKHGHREDD